MLAVSFVLIGTAARAQSAAPPGERRPLAERYVDTRGGLSVGDAVARAVEGEPSLRAARAELDVAHGRRVQSALRPNPTTSFERREEPAGTDNQTLFNVEWPLDLFRRSARVTVADREIEATEQAVDDRVRALVAEVRMRYGQAAAAVRDVAVADNLAISAERELDLLRQRVEEGASTPLERDLLDVELRRLEAERLLAMGRADAALFELKRMIGMPADAPLMLRDTLETLVSSDRVSGTPANDASSVPPLDAPMVRGRSDVREAEARVRVADSQIERARAEGRFDVSLFGSYMRMHAGFPQRGFGEQGRLERVRGTFHYLAGGAMVTVPLRNRNQGEVAAARAARVGAAARLEAAQLAAQAEIAAAAALDSAARQALVFAEGSVLLARQNLDVTRQTYELGRGTVSGVLAEQRRYLDVERAYTDTLRAAYEARTALRRARGEL